MKVTSVEFSSYETFNQDELRFAVIMASFQGNWIFVRHKDRSTLEIPGGRREPGEAILETARRELFEETGASKFELDPVAAYQVVFADGTRSSGLLCYSRVHSLGELPDSEIGEIMLLDPCPIKLTHPEIQPHLFTRIDSYLRENNLDR